MNVNYTDPSKVFFGRDDIIKNNHEANMEILKNHAAREQNRSDEEMKRIDYQGQLNRYNAEANHAQKIMEINQKGFIETIKVAGQLKIEEAKLKGDIAATTQKLNNQKNIDDHKNKEELERIKNDALKITEDYKLKQFQSQNNFNLEQQRIKNEEKKDRCSAKIRK